MWSKTTITMFFWLLVAAVHGCEKEPENYNPYAFLQIGDPVPKYDAYLTWQEYNIFAFVDENQKKAVYLWNGKPVGRGHAGFAEVLSEIKKMRRGSKILVYPSTMLTWMTSGSGVDALEPFVHEDELQPCLVSKRITLVYSPVDHEGKLCPECIPPSSYTAVRPKNPLPSPSWRYKTRCRRYRLEAAIDQLV